MADPCFDDRSLSNPVIPLGAGLIASYLKKHLPKMDVQVFKAVSSLIEAIKEQKPDIIGFSNYIWNTNLCIGVSEYAREINPKALIIFGGPEINSTPYKLSFFEKKYKVVDLFVQNEGEIAFLDIIKKYIECGQEVKRLTDEIQTLGNVFRIGKNGGIIKSPSLPRIADLDDIPSPYLMGFFDKFLSDSHNYLPMIQTNRGCPFSCTFCQEGMRYFTKVNKHSLEFVVKELDYIAERVDPSVGLWITDSNWAMYKEDVDIAKHIAKIQSRFQWPKGVISSTGKANLKRIIQVGKILNGAMFISNSVQSMNTDVLDTIKRKNLKKSELDENKADLAEMRQEPEIIIPLPNETKETFRAGLNQLLDIGTPQRFAVFQTLILSNSEMGEGKSIKEYDMKIKYRQHWGFMGYIQGKFICETERVVVSTSTMSTEEVCEGLVYSMLLDALLRFEPVAEIFRYLDSKAVQRSKLTIYMAGSIDDAPPGIIRSFEEFKSSFLDEMFDSEEEVIQYMEKYFDDYKLGDKGGGNLKFSNKLWIEHFESMMDWLFYSLLSILDNSKETQKEIQTLKSYLLTVFIDKIDEGNAKPSVITEEFGFDVKSWAEIKDVVPLKKFQGKTIYAFRQTELSKVDKLTQWKSFGFKREKGENYSPSPLYTRLYLVKLRRMVETVSNESQVSKMYEQNTHSEWMGKLTLN